MYEIITKFPVRFPDPVKHSHIKLSEEAQSIINKVCNDLNELLTIRLLAPP